MPATVKKEKYYTTKEACQLIGISRSTLLRWVHSGMLNDSTYRDRRGWRMFTWADIKRIKAEANKVKESNS